MRIAQVAPPWLEVPPMAYGGTEYVISSLTEELVKRGHDVTLFATANSKTSAKHVPIWPKGIFNDRGIKDAFAVFGLLYRELFERRGEFDIIQDHCDVYLTPLTPFLGAPVVSTIHGLISEEKNILYKKFPKINYVAISRSQKTFGPGINIVKTIHHGIEVGRYQFNSKPEDYVLWISNIAPDKGVVQAIEIAKMAGERLIIAGPVFPANSEYFDYRVRPLIDGKQIQFAGEAGFEKKVELFKNAKAMLFPVFDRQEPFGLVVIEAMACGTPVIAAGTGSMPELIEDGKTGFLVSSIEEAVDALKSIDLISRQDCRHNVMRKFSLNRMVNNYERLFLKLTGV